MQSVIDQGLDILRFQRACIHAAKAQQTTYLDENSDSDYRAEVNLDKTWMSDNEEHLKSIPSMTVLANIETGKKSMHIDEKTLKEIRHATQKGWVLGIDRFKDEIEHLLKRRARPLSRGGNHRSVEFQK